MPFGTCTWQGVPSQPHCDLQRTPLPVLQQTTANSFVLLESFCYQEPNDPEEITYVVPGADAPATYVTPERFVIPRPNGGKTDLASVPWFLWWLIASYGNHTRAALLHDALIPDKGVPEPVPGRTADKLFLSALREPQQKTGVMRHWLMWTAVSVFRTIGLVPRIFILLQLLAVWGLIAAALAWAWGPAIWPDSTAERIGITAVVVIGLAVFLVVLGSFWRFGVDRAKGWASPLPLLAVIIAVTLTHEWSSASLVSPFTFLVAASILIITGFSWGLAVDKTLRGWLWPTALIGLPIAAMPLGLIFLSVGLVGLLDIGAALAAAGVRTNGKRRGFKWPSPKPSRLPL